MKPLHEAAVDRMLAEERRRTINDILDAPVPKKPSKKRVVDNGQNDMWRCIWINERGENGHHHAKLKECLGVAKKHHAISISFVKADLRKAA